MATSSSHSRCLRIKLVLIMSVYMPVIFLRCDAGRAMEMRNKELKSVRHYDVMWSSALDSAYGIGSPFSLPPFESLAPVSMPEQGGSSQTTPPYCINPPFTPTPTNPYSPPAPSFYVPPIFPILSPPLQPSLNPYPPPQSTLTPPTYLPGLPPSPPSYTPTPGSGSGGGGAPAGGSGGGGGYAPNPPTSVTPSPPIGGSGAPGGSGGGGGYAPNPPVFVTPSPPIGGGGAPGGSGGGYAPNPPAFVTPSPPIGGGGAPGGSGGGFAPNPPAFVTPSPPVFQPPVIYPPPAAPPPPRHGESLTLWCVAKPSVPDPIIQEAMNYACGSGADCYAIQPNGNCYQPDTLLAHASYAFNSYWQMTKVGGGTCEFGGTAILVTVDPSHGGCHFPIT